MKAARVTQLSVRTFLRRSTQERELFHRKLNFISLANKKQHIGLATERMRILSLPPNDLVGNRLVANPIGHFHPVGQLFYSPIFANPSLDIVR